MSDFTPSPNQDNTSTQAESINTGSINVENKNNNSVRGFTHLHVHSHYSLLDGLTQIDDLIEAAKKQGATSIALTDHGSMYGAIEFYKKAKLAGIKPIVGMEAYMAFENLEDKRAKIDSDYYHLILLAKNFEGYRNLMRLATIGHLEGFYYHPRIDKKSLEKHAAGLICLSGCMRGDIPRALLNSDFEKAVSLAVDYKRMFGEENFFLEIQRHESKDAEYAAKENLLNERLVELARKTNTPLVATNDSHYLNPEDSEAQDLLLCVGLGRSVNDLGRLDMRANNIALRTEPEMKALFLDLPEAISNTNKVSDLCDLTIPLNERYFPDPEIPEGHTADSYLSSLAHEGLAKKYGQVPVAVLERLEYELDVIVKKNYSGYFIVVADFVNWARSRGIIATTRGSAAGSLVSYAIGITTVNPLDYNLPFERFLNPMRPSPPDIDMDFADNRRDEVIAYVTEKYGADKVAQIVTFGTMMARAAVRDMGRALAIPYAKCDLIAKMIPIGKQGFHMTIQKALSLSPELKDVYEKDPETRKLIDLSMKVEGAARHASVHAAGLVIAPSTLTNFTPLQKDQDEKIITQYDMYSVEDAGLVKMDFLGIRNLSILGNTVEIVKHTKNAEVDLQNIPLNDKKTFQLLAAGKTMGMFQLGGSGMTRYLKELGPSNIFDIMAMISLYRPGPMESIPEYIRRKHNPKLVTYTDTRLKEILSMSYGIITFQDDVLLIAIHIAGYTWEEADKLRKAMGKKIPAEMAAQKEKFIKGCMENGDYSKDQATHLWSLIEPFAAYGFGKAHAASYAIVSYQTAYMKANYPVEFMAALMTAEAGDPATVADAVEECKQLKIEVLPPDVNESLANFTVIDDRHIRFGLNAVKNLGSDVIETTIKERKKDGKFKDIEDFVLRMHTRNFNKKSWEALVKSGALDSFGERGALLGNTESILEFARAHVKAGLENQVSLFGAGMMPKIKLKLREVSPATKKEKLAWEKELLGLYVSAHPLDDYAKALKNIAFPIRNIANAKGSTTIGGVITKIQRILTKKGDQMAFMDVEDTSGIVEVLVFPTLYQKYKDLIFEEKILLISGKVSDKDGVPKFLADEMREIGATSPASGQDTARTQSITIQIPENTQEEIFIELKKVFESFPGDLPVNLMIKEQQIKTPFRISLTDDLKSQISVLLGQEFPSISTSIK